MKSWALGMAAVLAAIVANASAETVGVSLQGGPATTGTYYSPGVSVNVQAVVGGRTSNYNAAGAFRWQVNSDSASTFSGNVGGAPLYTFCIQLFQTTGNSYSVANLNSGAPLGGTDAGYINATAAAQIQGLVDSFWNQIDFNNSVSTNYSFNGTSYSDNVVAGAFQLAVWEIEYDGGSSGESYNLNNGTNYFGGGKFTANGTGSGQSAINLANAWLNSTAWSADSNISSLALESSSYQDQLYGIPNAKSGAQQPTPLPASLPAGLGLMIGLAVFRKFRKSKA